MKISTTNSSWQPPVSLPATPTSSGRRLQRKCACGGSPGPTGECETCKRKRLQTKLTVNQPGDRFEQEADRMAEFVTAGRGAGTPPTLSSIASGAVQREDPKTPPAPNNYEDAAKGIAGALAETQAAKDLKEKAAKMGKDFLSSVEGKVIAGSALGGALAAIIATNSELPMQIPEVPLDFIAPGLKAKLVYEGPVQKPTNVSLQLTSKSGVSVTGSYSDTAASEGKPAEQKGGLALSIPLGASAEKKKGGPTAADKFRAGTARMAAEQEKFRAGLQAPGEKAADNSFVDNYVRSKFDASNPLGLPPLKKKEDAPLMRKESAPSSASTLAPPIVDDVLGQSGQPLDRATRGQMEARFGYDFGRVRVHHDARAAASARAVHAHAYTVGDQIVFDAGRYTPGSPAGQRLLAHELTHVIQQSTGAGEALQRDEKPEERIDVALVFGDEADAMTEGRSYAPTALRVTSGDNAKEQLLKLGKPIGKIYVVSHSNSAGQVQVISKIGTTSMQKLSDLSAELKGLPADKAPVEIDFRGCRLGNAPGEMETFRKNIGAQKARGMTCWSIVHVITPMVLPDGTPLTDPSQIPARLATEVDRALVRQINSLESDDHHPVKNCIEGLAANEKADANLAKIKKLYFAHKGNLAAVWASPEYNHDWQKDSLCVKDLTDKTTPCTITEVNAPTAPPPASAPPKKGAMLEDAPDTRVAGPDAPPREAETVA